MALIPTWRNTALAKAYINIGNISFARYDLVSFPGGAWDERHDDPAMAGTRAWFDHALKYAPNHPGAHYRLGLIAYRLHDFPAAAYHLEKAYRAGLDQKGVLKHLAYSYVWSGHLATAMPLLIQIPESGKEMVDYISRWDNLTQKELSERAQQAAFALSH
jgi:tetratricopeptide (TPR) repeat protein